MVSDQLTSSEVNCLCLPWFKKGKSELKLFFTSYCLYVISKVLVMFIQPFCIQNG